MNRRAAALAALSDHPSWPEFQAECQRKVERLKKTASVISLAEGGADQRKLDQIRGTIAAIVWMSGLPAASQLTMARFIREQMEEEVPA